MIISPKAKDEEMSKLVLLNKAAEKLSVACTSQTNYLHNDSVTKKRVKDIIRKVIKNNYRHDNEFFIFYGEVLNHFLCGSDGNPILDLNDIYVRKYIKEKVFYVITPRGGTTSKFGNDCKGKGAKTYIGFKSNKGFYFGTPFLQVINKFPIIESGIIEVINNTVIKMCCENKNETEAMADTEELCVKKAQEIYESQRIDLATCALDFFTNFIDDIKAA